MITLEETDSKKLGLPGYSSHQCSITLRTEIADVDLAVLGLPERGLGAPVLRPVVRLTRTTSSARSSPLYLDNCLIVYI